MPRPNGSLVIAIKPIAKKKGEGGVITTPVTLYEKTAQTKLTYFPQLYDHTSYQGTAE